MAAVFYFFNVKEIISETSGFIRTSSLRKFLRNTSETYNFQCSGLSSFIPLNLNYSPKPLKMRYLAGLAPPIRIQNLLLAYQIARVVLPNCL